MLCPIVHGHDNAEALSNAKCDWLSGKVSGEEAHACGFAFGEPDKFAKSWGHCTAA